MISKQKISHGIRALKKSDPRLKKLISKAGPFSLKIQKTQSVFEALIESIVFQQLHAKAARTIFNRVKALFDGQTFPDAKAILKVSDAVYRSAGLSGAKTAALRDLARHHLEGKLPDLKALKKLSNSEIVSSLTQVRGIGPWTVEMLLIFRLGRLDVMPASDYGVRSGFAVTYGKRGLPSPKDLLNFSAKWHPYQTIAAWYFWRAIDLKRAKAA